MKKYFNQILGVSLIGLTLNVWAITKDTQPSRSDTTPQTTTEDLRNLLEVLQKNTGVDTDKTFEEFEKKNDKKLAQKTKLRLKFYRKFLPTLSSKKGTNDFEEISDLLAAEQAAEAQKIEVKNMGVKLPKDESNQYLAVSLLHPRAYETEELSEAEIAKLRSFLKQDTDEIQINCTPEEKAYLEKRVKLIQDKVIARLKDAKKNFAKFETVINKEIANAEIAVRFAEDQCLNPGKYSDKSDHSTPPVDESKHE